MDIIPLMITSETKERRDMLNLYTEKAGEYIKKHSSIITKLIDYQNISRVYHKGEMHIIDRSTLSLFENYLDSLEKGVNVNSGVREVVYFYMTRIYDVYLTSLEISGKEKKMDVLDILGHEESFLGFRDVVEYYISILYCIINTQDELFFDIGTLFD